MHVLHFDCCTENLWGALMTVSLKWHEITAFLILPVSFNIVFLQMIEPIPNAQNKRWKKLYVTTDNSDATILTAAAAAAITLKSINCDRHLINNSQNKSLFFFLISFKLCKRQKCSFIFFVLLLLLCFTRYAGLTSSMASIRYFFFYHSVWSMKTYFDLIAND